MTTEDRGGRPVYLTSYNLRKQRTRSWLWRGVWELITEQLWRTWRLTKEGLMLTSYDASSISRDSLAVQPPASHQPLPPATGGSADITRCRVTSRVRTSSRTLETAAEYRKQRTENRVRISPCSCPPYCPTPRCSSASSTGEVPRLPL